MPDLRFDFTENYHIATLILSYNKLHELANFFWIRLADMKYWITLGLYGW